jgi:putative hemolysin
MKKLKNILKWILIIFGLIAIINLTIYITNEIDKSSSNNLTQVPNPASANCINLGGELEIRSREEGGQYGVCIKDEKECEEWELFRGDCEL